MRIGIDARVLDRAITGTGRYLYNILNELPNHDSKNGYYIFTNTSLYLDREFYKIIPYRESFLPMKLYSPFWLNVDIPRLLKNYKIDLLFAANVLTPLLKIKGVKFVSVVHDAIFKVFKEYYPFFYRQYLSLYLPISLKNSDRIITVSKLSKDDIVKYFGTDENKIRVIHNTASAEFKLRDTKDDSLTNILEKYNLPSKYLLYVGAVEKRKNVLGIINIVDRLREKGSKLKLVIIGRPGYNTNNILPEIEKRNEVIKYYKYVDDGDLAAIYSRAFAFIFPSYYEGFGIPPLEAMQSGIPILSSNTSALLEVVGEGGILHNPDDHISFVNDILKLERDTEFYLLMKSKALAQSNKFSIKDTTKKLVEVFNELSS